MKKYELTEQTIEHDGRTLYRIRALKSFLCVEAGDLGGYIEKEENLSHEGDAWVFEEAKVYEEARVYEDARVGGNARVYGHARVYGLAIVEGQAQIFENTQAARNVIVVGNAEIYGNAHIEDITMDGEMAFAGDTNIGGYLGS